MRRICLVGAGFIFRVHAAALQGASGARIASVVGTDAARRLSASLDMARAHDAAQRATTVPA